MPDTQTKPMAFAMSSRTMLPVKKVDGKAAEADELITIENCPENSDLAVLTIAGKVYHVYRDRLSRAVRCVNLCSEAIT